MNHLVGLRFVLLATVLSACGGGGGSGTGPVPEPEPPPGPSSEPPRTFLIRGIPRISGADYCFDTGTQNASSGVFCVPISTGARLSLDGAPLDRARLDDPGRRNSMAVVSGSSPGGVSTLDLERIVEGAIQSIDIAHARIGVLGMRVYVTPATNIDGGSDLTLLQANDHVSISGYFGAGRDLIATAILREPSSNTFLLRGILQLGAGGNVQVGGQTVGDLASLTAIGFPAAPANGDAVLVTGNVSGGTPSARSMQYIGGAWAEGTEDIRMLTGLVTRRSHPSDLEIEGREIDCALYPCSELNIAGSGARVGITRVGDVRLVDTATPLNPPLGGLTVSGPIDAIDSANDSLTVLGFAVQRVPMTVVADDAGMPSQLADIRAGDSITVRGAPVGNVIVAGSITPTDVEPTVSFLSRSPYVTVEDSTITVAGQPISIDATTTYEKYSTCFDTPSFTSFLTRVTMNVSRTDTGSLFAHHVKLSKIMRPCP